MDWETEAWLKDEKKSYERLKNYFNTKNSYLSNKNEIYLIACDNIKDNKITNDTIIETTSTILRVLNGVYLFDNFRIVTLDDVIKNESSGNLFSSSIFYNKQEAQLVIDKYKYLVKIAYMIQRVKDICNKRKLKVKIIEKEYKTEVKKTIIGRKSDVDKYLEVENNLKYKISSLTSDLYKCYLKLQNKGEKLQFKLEYFWTPVSTLNEQLHKNCYYKDKG